MKYRDKLLFALLACASCTVIATERNETSNSITIDRDNEDDDVRNMITAAILSRIAEDYSEEHSEHHPDYLAHKDALLELSQAMLDLSQEISNTETTTTSGYGVQDSDGVEYMEVLDDASDSENTTSETEVEQLEEIEETQIKSADTSKEEETKRVLENVLLGMRAMPDDASFWDLMKAQIQADFAPFLIIIPRPVKRMIAKGAVRLVERLKVIIGGPLAPMIVTAGRVLKLAGEGVVYVGNDVVRFAVFLTSVGDNPHNTVATESSSIVENKVFESGGIDYANNIGDAYDDIVSEERVDVTGILEHNFDQIVESETEHESDHLNSSASEEDQLIRATIDIDLEIEPVEPVTIGFNTDDSVVEIGNSSIDSGDEDMEYVEL